MTVRADLPNPATVSYNGVTFDVGSYVTLESRPVPSSDGRTVVYVSHALQVDGWVNVDNPGPNDNTDTLMGNLHQRLSTAGGALAVVGVGVGAMQINLANATDVL